MTEWVPSWLARQYSLILTNFWTSLFNISETERAGVTNPRVVLPRLTDSGWLERVDRGVYRAVHPLAVLSDLRFRWRVRIRQRVYLPLLEFVLARLWEGFGERLRAVLLFGSVARGEARENSDVDLLVVADGMPARYGERVRSVLAMVEGWESVKRCLAERHRVHPNLDLILLDAGEVETLHPFYFDVAREGVVLYDRDGLVSKRLESLREALERLGARRIQLPSGKWYWLLPEGIEELSAET